MIAEFVTGMRMLLRGFGLWRTHPRLMLWGLVPAVIAAIILAALLIPYGFALGPITGWLTPFAEGWSAPWRMLLRGALGTVLFLAAAALAVAAFTALALALGDPFYQRIWMAVEAHLGDMPDARGSSFTAALGEGLRLLVIGVRNALIVLLLGVIPLVGGLIAALIGAVLSGRLLARELTARSFDARALARTDRKRILSARRARVLGFGIATQLCFLVPFGAVLVMPAAVAGATHLARSLLTAPENAAIEGQNRSVQG